MTLEFYWSLDWKENKNQLIFQTEEESKVEEKV